MLRLDTLSAFDEDLARLLAAEVDLTPLNYVIGVLLKGKKLNPICDYTQPPKWRTQSGLHLDICVVSYQKNSDCNA